MNHPSRVILFIAALALPLMACEDDEPETSDYDTYAYWASDVADFSSYQTFQFADIPADVIADMDLPDYVINNQSEIKALVTAELEAQGLTEDTDTEDADNPDLVVSSVAAVTGYEAWVAECEAGWYWYSWSSCAYIDYDYYTYELGTIVIPVVDAATEELVFAGALEGILDDSEDAQARIEEGVHWVFTEGWPQE